MFKGAPKAEIKTSWAADLVAPALACAGILILIAGLRENRSEGTSAKEPAAASLTRRPADSVTMRQAGWMGPLQGLCLPFRGFSRLARPSPSGC